MAVEVFIHKMSEHMASAEIVQWLAKEGDRVEKFQVIVEVMTDKVTAELEAPASGILKGIRPGAAEEGAQVPVGEVIAFIAEAGEAVPVLPPLPGHKPAEAVRTEGPAVLDPGQATPPRASIAAGAEGEGVRSTPAARHLARELGVEITRIRGTGPGGRVTEEDVRASASAAQPRNASRGHTF
jgi:pyruvate/2-oxoglutarate dehydrogenase complex dihydrolipoamide acyltransferase (E2) component